MEVSRYFEHKLFYDCNSLSVEHYEQSEERVFEPASSRTRLAVCVQLRRAETEVGNNEDVVTLLKGEGYAQSESSKKSVHSHRCRLLTSCR